MEELKLNDAPAQPKINTGEWFASLQGVHKTTTQSGLPIVAHFERREDGRVFCKAKINIEAECDLQGVDSRWDAIFMCADKIQQEVEWEMLGSGCKKLTQSANA